MKADRFTQYRNSVIRSETPESTSSTVLTTGCETAGRMLQGATRTSDCYAKLELEIVSTSAQ